MLTTQVVTQLRLTPFVREVVLPDFRLSQPRIDPRACRFPLKAHPSAIHRWGIFAAELIPAHRLVMEYTGQLIDVNEVWRRSIRHHLYIFWIDEFWALDGAIGGSGAEFINHSCEPNLYATAVGRRIEFMSRRSIAKGEELTLDYNLEGTGPDIPCLCGSNQCRGVVNSTEKIPRD